MFFGCDLRNVKVFWWWIVKVGVFWEMWFSKNCGYFIDLFIYEIRMEVFMIDLNWLIDVVDVEIEG